MPLSVFGGSGKRSEEHTSELQSLRHLVCRLLLEKKKKPLRGPDNKIINRLNSRNALSVFPFLSGFTDDFDRSFTAQECFDVFFFFNDTATTEIYTLSLHDALPI